MEHSTRQRRLRAALTIACALTLAGTTQAKAANCKFTYTDMHNVTATLNFGTHLNADSFTIPRDAPIGTLVYQQSLNSAEHIFTCSAASRYGFTMNPALGVPVSNTYPLGKTGLSFRVGTPHPNITHMPPPFAIGSGTYTTNGGNYTLEIFKSAELASTNEVPAGFLGNLQATDLVFVQFYLANPIKLNTASCQTPSVPVEMGNDYSLHEFAKAGDAPRPIKFNIALNQCQRGIKKVTYQLKATTAVIDSSKGIVALNASSTAKGIGLQLMNEAGQPIALDTPYTFSGFDPGGSDFKIPLSAAYYRLAEGRLEAGSANTAVTFIMNYL
ncbi:fimbrial protein [Pseudomonas rubra]|uniref:Fimbrial protein n=1 Tax=Pseudomonas rubra TaxID=2942627 RepID=A0ABT5PBP2_9PSED|nr:fimbrial protein [Pseudomonas rubra]MDD1015453.1 fimbrial protein [Pseudomonas rubra]MDD1041267.1 fimbrial protein [Pseudomonas rubra]MDD1153646.1 fimbrial protein [Pseudomonas rubra]